MTEDTNQPDIEIPGYTLTDRLGAGGYGEVWRAQAPGGLTKAVKIVYGYHNEKRATHELHALERIKEVRHPFLISHERIEIIDGRLVIVTELADASLKDRFDACVENGEAGIPRSELLGYMTDAADALDFLSDQHALQHLDVKPENLLLLAGHVKVADFGLVKSVQDPQASLVGGMTPLYSAPEVFRGRPSRQSDQYSLAVLYQELLTGMLPFSGMTAAELTIQHMNDAPDVSPLPDVDRYVIARAMSKQPEQRYASCSEMVRALLGKGGDASSGFAERVDTTAIKPSEFESRRGSTTVRPPRPGAVTQVLGEDVETDAVADSESMLLELPPLADRNVAELPPIDLNADDFRPAPTLLIGIGGAAGYVLQNVRRRLAKRGGDQGVVPAVQMLLLDTDARSLIRATRGDDSGALKNEETLALALRRPQEYRKQSDKLQHWLGRRWLYNIPRSLRTEGLRPLGRLAFVDHTRQALQRIRMALSQAVEAESIATSREQTGLPFRNDCVRVYVVASISGGTGSGMSLDVGYAVRLLLEKMGITSATTTGIFMHSTGRDPRSCDLAKVNAFAWLTEFNHFNRSGGSFPGDPACGLPARPIGEKTFDNTYLVHLGETLGEEEFVQATESVADYLYLDAITPAQTFFDACRQDDDQSSQTPLRTFALKRVTAASRNEIEEAASALSHQVVSKWAGIASKESPVAGSRLDHASQDTAEVATSDTNQLVSGAAQIVANLKLDLEGITFGARTLIEEQFEGGLETSFQKMLCESSDAGQRATTDQMLRAVDRMFSDPDEVESQDTACVLRRPVQAIVRPLSTQIAESLRRWLLDKLDDREERVSRTIRAVEWLTEHLHSVDVHAERRATELTQQLAKTVRGIATEPLVETSEDGMTEDGAIVAQPQLEFALRYCRLKIDRCAFLATGALARTLQAELTTTRQTALELGRNLKHLAENMVPVSDPFALQETSECEHQPANLHEHVQSMLRARAQELVDCVDERVQSKFIDPHGGLMETIMGNSRLRADLLSNVRQAALHTVEQFVGEVSVLRSDSLSTEQSDQDTLGEMVAATIPRLIEYGGKSRHLVIFPKEKTSEDNLQRLVEALDTPLSVLRGSDNDLVVCCDAGELPLAHVAVQLVERRRDYADFAARVHTRKDVPWIPLVGAKVRRSDNVPELQTQMS